MATINFHTEDYIREEKPIRIVLSGENDDGETVELDSISVDPSDFPADIMRRHYANGLERLISGRVSQYSKEGNEYRFARIRDDVLPLWYEGIWRPRKRSAKVEVQAVAEVFNQPYKAIDKARKDEPKKWEKILQMDKVQEKIRELLDAESKPAESISLDALLEEEKADEDEKEEKA